MIVLFMFTIVVALLIGVLFAPFFIPILRRLKFGQFIRTEGPQSHQKKAGTPTMGGIVIIFAWIIGTYLMALKYHFLTTDMYLLFIVTVGFAIIGFLDDLLKILRKQNLGLTSRQKLLGQLIVAVIFYVILHRSGFSTFVGIPGTPWKLDFGWAYVILVIVMLIGASNGTNLTDGMDGLLSGTATFAFAAYALIGYYTYQIDIAIFACAAVGALLAFLVFNAHPAKVFMGDTGSLAIGGALAGLAILTKSEILLIVIGGIYVIETLSVMIQVTSFKLTGKRVFKMSPIHHHYELSGWSEWRIVSTFWFVSLIFAAIGIYLKVML